MAPSSSKPTSPTWQLEDFIDFDYALESESKSGTLTAHEHREIFLEFAATQKSATPTASQQDRPLGFRFWLEAKRKKEPLSKLLPGQLFCRGLHSLKILLMLLAVLSGTLITATLLHYDGTQPTNVAGFLTVLLGGQILLLSLAGLSYALRRFGLLKQQSGVITPLIVRALNHVLEWIQKRTETHGSAELRLQLKAFLGTAAKKQSQYQSIILGLVASLIQSFGIWFNVAALATSLFLVTVSDRAFGWQSSLNVTAEQTHRFTQIIALPWSFIFPAGAPTRTEIEGSRIFLKDGIKRLTNENLVSWWPFLVCSLAVYGLIPRLALWFVCRAYVRNRFRSIQFDSLSCDRLWESMTTQELRTSGKVLHVEESPPPPLRVAPPTPPKAQPPVPEPEEQMAILIVDPELAKRIDRGKTDAAVEQAIGWSVHHWIRLPDETQSSSDFWNAIEPLRSEKSFERIILIQEAFQPPIRETIEWLQQLRATQSKKGKMMIYLVGRPQEAGKRREVCETNQRVWSQTIDSLTDDNLGVAVLELSNASE